MDLVSLRPWHWILIGLIFGGLIGYAYSGSPTSFARSGEIDQFRSAVRTYAVRAEAKQVPRIRNVTVYESDTDRTGTVLFPVTYDIVAADPQGQAMYRSEGLFAANPFFGRDSIKEFLTKNKVSFADRSGNAQYIPAAYSAAAGVLVIGIFWPFVISLLVTAGFVPERVIEAKPEKAKKASAGSYEDKSLVKAGSRAVTGGDLRDLNSLNDDMESKLAAGLSAGGPRAATATAEEPVSVLMSGTGSRSTTDPTAAVAPTEPGKPKDYKGEWYPVARPIVKKDGER